MVTITKKWSRIMKTGIATFSALCLFAIAAIPCSKEENGTSPAEFETFRLNAVSEATRTHLHRADVIWDNGDAKYTEIFVTGRFMSNKLMAGAVATART